MGLTEKETRFIKVLLVAIATAVITYIADIYYENHHLGR